MVTQEAFYEQTNKNFATVFDKIDGIKEDVAELREDYNIHIAVGEALEKKSSLSRKQKIGIVLAVIPVVVTVLALFLV